MIINHSKRFRIFCTTQTIFQGVILYTKYKRKKNERKDKLPTNQNRDLKLQG